MWKRFLLVLCTAFTLATVTSAQAPGLSAEEINELSKRVVYILGIQNGEPVATGSGTLVSPDGMIFTNRHVVEGMDDLAILLLDDPNELPGLQYYASPQLVFEEMDFAVLQIDRDADGNALLRTSLDLPFLDATEPAPVSRGDRVFVMGYPDVGDGYFTLTNGAISNIRNGDIGSERMPIWYGTDAEIAPGNSGGLAVTEDGRPVGIPTAVSHEDRTGGRIGMILPFEAVYALIESGTGTAPNRSNRGTTDNNTNTGEQQLQFEITNVEYDVTDPDTGEIGMRVTAYILASGFQGVPLRAGLFFYWDDNTPLMAQNENYAAPDGALTTQTVITPEFEATEWSEFVFWMPYSAMPFDFSGERNAVIIGSIGIDGDSFLVDSPEWPFVMTGAGQETTTTTTLSGASAVCDNGMVINNGVEIIVSQMRPGFEYKATVIGVGGFDPVLGVLPTGSNEAAICSDDSSEAAQYSVSLPTTGAGSAASTSSQVTFRQSSSNMMDVSFIVGGYEGSTGEFLLVLEGMAATPADVIGDPFVVMVTPNVAASGVPVSAYMIGTEASLDPLMYLSDNEGNPLQVSGQPVVCDDAGSTSTCWGTSFSLVDHGVISNRSTFAADERDAMLVLPVSDLQETTPLTLIMTSYQRESTGRYLLAFHIGFR